MLKFALLGGSLANSILVDSLHERPVLTRPFQMSELQFHALVELDVVMRGRTKAVHPPNVRVPHDEELRLFEMHNFRGPVCSAPALNAS